RGHLRIADVGSGGLIHQPLELRASGWSIEKAARTGIANGKAPHSLLSRMHAGFRRPIKAQDVAEAAQNGDELALSILLRAWSDLAEGICQVIALLCPQRIVIGGGVSLMGEDLLFRPLRALVAERVFAPFANCFEIVPAALGEEVVVHGALALARKRMERHKR